MSSARGGLARKTLGFAYEIDEVIPGRQRWKLHFGVMDFSTDGDLCRKMLVLYRIAWGVAREGAEDGLLFDGDLVIVKFGWVGWGLVEFLGRYPE